MRVNAIDSTVKQVRFRSVNGSIKGLCSGLSSSRSLITGWLTSIALLSSTIALAQSFTVEFNDTKISIQANEASLRDIMLDIEDKTGIPVKFVAESEEHVSVEIYDQTLESAIGKLTPNHMIVHDLLNGKKRIKELIIISEDPQLAKDGGSQFLPSGQLQNANPTPQPAVDNEDNQSNDKPAPEDKGQPIPDDATNGAPALTQSTENN